MSREDYAFESDDPEALDKRLSMELLSTEGGRVVTLVCISTQKLTPQEFALALRDYADHIEDEDKAGSKFGGTVN